MALNNVDPGSFKQALINRVESCNLFGLVVAERGPIKGDVLCTPAKSLCLPPRCGIFARVDVQLFGDTADINAGAAQGGFFYYCHARAKFGAFSGGTNAAGASADHHQVVIKMLSH